MTVTAGAACGTNFTVEPGCDQQRLPEHLHDRCDGERHGLPHDHQHPGRCDRAVRQCRAPACRWRGRGHGQLRRGARYHPQRPDHAWLLRQQVCPQAHLYGHRRLRQQQQPDSDYHRQRHHRPVLTSIPTDVTVQCASAVPAPNDGAVVATDNCGGAVVITHSDQTIPGSCVNKFVLKRTYTATDVCGNSNSQTQTITVNDTTAPVIHQHPGRCHCAVRQCRARAQ